jgi:hypothetical protein
MTGDDGPAPPRSFVEPFLDRERAARDVLDDPAAYREREAVPLVRYHRYSGAVELLESRESPDELLQVASFLVGVTAETLENAIGNGDTVNTEELSDLLDRRDDLEDTPDELRTQPVGK